MTPRTIETGGGRARRLVRAVTALTCACWWLTACAAPQRSTRLTAADLTDMSTEMAQSLAQSDTLAQRGPDSPPWIITIDKVRNLSSDVMTDSEQWAVVARLRGELPIQALAQQKNIHFVIPAQRVEQLRRDPNMPEYREGFGAKRKPTHQMSATFRSITRADAEHRSDLYYAEFEILDMQTGEPAWTDRFEFKRAAKGHVWD